MANETLTQGPVTPQPACRERWRQGADLPTGYWYRPRWEVGGLPNDYAARMLRVDQPIKTERLVLRPLRPDDLDAVNAFDSLPEVARYLYFDARDRDESRVNLERMIEQRAITKPGDRMSLAVELAATGDLIGDVILEWSASEHLQGEIGYVLHPDHHGRGYATEAGRELLRMGFDLLGLHRIIARCDARNGASARVMERLGMRREGHLVENEFIKGEWTDELVYAMLEQEWRSRAPAGD